MILNNKIGIVISLIALILFSGCNELKNDFINSSKTIISEKNYIQDNYNCTEIVYEFEEVWTLHINTGTNKITNCIINEE